MSHLDENGGLARTPLYEVHRALGAKLVEFGGWEMPVSYRGILEEHRAVRTAAGLFDVSHMGEIEVLGPQAAATCQRLTTNDVRRLANGHVQYTLLCREDGGVVDDVTLYRVTDQRYFFCVNASNIAKDLAWIQEHAGAATVVDRSDATALIAIQGPAAARVVQGSTRLPLDILKRFRFARSEVAGQPALISRTGYTGEDGFEIFVDAPRATALWSALMAVGRESGIEPIGLGARDTLRLEAGLALYGHELDDSTSPLAAGLGRWVKLDGEDFIGRSALLHEHEQGAPRRLVGLALRGPGIARQGYAVVYEGATVGIVTSGTLSPTLGSAVALAYVAASLATPGTSLAIDIRGRVVPAEVVPTPFYRRERPATVTVPETVVAPAADEAGTTEMAEPVGESSVVEPAVSEASAAEPSVPEPAAPEATAPEQRAPERETSATRNAEPGATGAEPVTVAEAAPSPAPTIEPNPPPAPAPEEGER